MLGNNRTVVSLAMESSCEYLREVVFVLGGPGSGKAALCTLIHDEFEYVHLSPGNLLRAQMRVSGPASDLIGQTISQGGVVPAEITVGLLANAMKSTNATRFIIDGFPRNMENLLTWYNSMSGTTIVPFVINLDLKEEDLLARLLERGKSSERSDDSTDVMINRSTMFYEDALPVLDSFRMCGKLRTISSLPPPEAVFRHAARLFESINILPPYQRTFAIIKPDAVKNGDCPAILLAIQAAHLVVVDMKLIMMTVDTVLEFYAEHSDRDYFPRLMELMISGPAVVIVLEGSGKVKSLSVYYTILYYTI